MPTGSLERPNILLLGSLSLVAALSVALVSGSSRVALTASILLGMFAGVVLLGLTRLDANGKRARGRFAEWRFESVRIATLLFVIGWIGGLVSLWRFALVLSRQFT